MRTSYAALAALLAVIGVVACGSGDDTRPFTEIKRCLTAAADGSGFAISTDNDDMDYIAQDAGEGAAVLTSDKQEITVVVERSRTDANKTSDAYEAFDVVGENLKVDGRSVVAYSKTPTDGESGPIDACVAGGDVAKLPGSSENVASDDDTEPVADSDEAEQAEVYLGINEGGKDDGLGFKVLSLEEVASIPPAEEYSSAVYAPPNGKLVAAEVEMTNYGKTSMDPFCGSNGAVLLDLDERNYELDTDAMIEMGAPICDGGVAPGFTEKVTLPFKVPPRFKMGVLILWNSDSADSDGEESELIVEP